MARHAPKKHKLSESGVDPSRIVSRIAPNFRQAGKRKGIHTVAVVPAGIRAKQQEVGELFRRRIIGRWLDGLPPGGAVIARSTGDNMAAILAAMAARLAPAEVWGTTWGLSDPAVRILRAAKKAGYISGLYIGADAHVLAKRSGAWAFLESVADKAALISGHAKIYAVRGELGGYGIVSSANLTRNPHDEGHYVTQDAEMIEFLVRWVEEKLEAATEKAN